MLDYVAQSGNTSHMERERIGILGGTFNPVHAGHLIVAQDALELFGLSHVLFVPCFTPPHKDAPLLAMSEHRLAMLEACLEGEMRFSVSDVEIRRGGTSYAYDTVKELKKLYPDHDLDFIIGSDMLPELHLWKNLDQLLELCEFKTLVRPGTEIDNLLADSLNIGRDWAEKVLANATTGHLVEISSSEIRHRIAEGLSISYLVHPAVEMYISEHSLYT